MSAASLLGASSLRSGPSLELRLDQDTPPQCRFCGCTEFRACAIPIAEDLDGTVRLARNEQEISNILPCSWYVDRVCNAPRCIQKLLEEWAEMGEPRVLLFDAAGRKLPVACGDPACSCAPHTSLPGDPLLDLESDLEADDRDFELIGRELGLRPEELSREAILDRIRELRRLSGEATA